MTQLESDGPPWQGFLVGSSGGGSLADSALAFRARLDRLLPWPPRLRGFDVWTGRAGSSRPTGPTRYMASVYTPEPVTVLALMRWCFAQGSKAMHSTSGEPWRTVPSRSPLAWHRLRLKIPSLARSSYLWQAAQHTLPTSSQTQMPRHILLDTLDGYDFLPPPRPCVCDMPVYCPVLAAARFISQAAARHLFGDHGLRADMYHILAPMD